LRGSRDDRYREPGENSNQAETIVTIHRDLLFYNKPQKTGGACAAPKTRLIHLMRKRRLFSLKGICFSL
jgi:hypothetical protein